MALSGTQRHSTTRRSREIVISTHLMREALRDLCEICARLSSPRTVESSDACSSERKCARRSAVHVIGPTVPSARRPHLIWKSSTACWVRGPKLPSTLRALVPVGKGGRGAVVSTCMRGMLRQPCLRALVPKKTLRRSCRKMTASRRGSQITRGDSTRSLTGNRSSSVSVGGVA